MPGLRLVAECRLVGRSGSRQGGRISPRAQTPEPTHSERRRYREPKRRPGFHRAVARTDLPRIGPRDLRHTRATHLIAAGQKPKLVSDRLGHATVGFTLDSTGT